MPDTLSSDEPGTDSNGVRPHLVLVLECAAPMRGPARWALDFVDRVDIGRADGSVRSMGRSRVDGARTLVLRIGDPRISVDHARIVRIGSRFVFEDVGSKNGSVVNGAPTRRAVLEDGDVIEIGESFWAYREVSGSAAESDLDLADPVTTLPGTATILPDLARLYDDLAVAARANVPIVIEGETGTGKELVARAVHAQSGRPGPFVAINCAAIAPTLLESELFGHRRGAFSGATEDRPGLVRSAHGGTLFLDEVGDLSPAAQGALLRVLQESEVLPIGATVPAPVDLRVVAATHRDLREMVGKNTFRADLLARLDGFRFRTMPLRERLEDIGLLVATLLRRLPEEQRPRALTHEAGRRLLGYGWPANIRELSLTLTTAAALCTNRLLDATRLPEAERETKAQVPSESEGDEAFRTELVGLLVKHAGNVTAIAREMRKDRTQVRRWLRRFALDPGRYRG